MEQTASTSQAPESSQAAVMTDDSSAKTIEFLRARLLAERSSSKAARKEAQEISEKVKALNAQLEAEMESRKAAEAAMARVFTILKAKGLADAELVLVPEHQVELAADSTVDDTKEMNKMIPPGYTENSCIDIKEEDSHDSSHNSTVESQASTEENQSSQNSHGEVQLALRDKPMVYTDKTSAACVPYSEDNLHPSQANEKGSSITQKLKAMVKKMEEEMVLLPMEQQPLKLELQGWMDHVTRVLEKERDAAFGGAIKPASAFGGAIKPASNSLFEERTACENGRMAATASDGVYPLTMNPPCTSTEKMRHNRRSSCDSLEFLREPLNRPIMHPQMKKNGISHSLRYPDSLSPLNSPRSDAVSASSSSEAGLRQDQSRGLGQEGRAAGYGEDACLKCGFDSTWSPTGLRSRQPLSARLYVTADVPDELHSSHGSRYSHAYSLRKGGYPGGDDDQTWRSPDYSQYFHFPSSSASEHGYPPSFENHSRHRRSSSVSINDTMSGWPRKGEVQLGNGITLFTD